MTGCIEKSYGIVAAALPVKTRSDSVMSDRNKIGKTWIARVIKSVEGKIPVPPQDNPKFFLCISFYSNVNNDFTPYDRLIVVTGRKGRRTIDTHKIGDYQDFCHCLYWGLSYGEHMFPGVYCSQGTIFPVFDSLP